jgi:rare lipoprotein A
LKTATRGVLAALACGALIPATAAGSTTGGTPYAPPKTYKADPSFKLRVTAGYVKRRLRIRGVVRRAAGRRVRIERRTRTGRWIRVAGARVDSRGRFVASWRPRRSGRYRLRGVLVPSSASLRAGSPKPKPRASRSRRITIYRRELATWYGPGFWGRRTACGRRLRTTTLGVAHRRLPCGTRVALYYRGRSLTVPVIDRGPFIKGVSWDLTRATARRLRIRNTTRIGVLPLPPRR